MHSDILTDLESTFLYQLLMQHYQNPCKFIDLSFGDTYYIKYFDLLYRSSINDTNNKAYSNLSLMNAIVHKPNIVIILHKGIRMNSYSEDKQAILMLLRSTFKYGSDTKNPKLYHKNCPRTIESDLTMS